MKLAFGLSLTLIVGILIGCGGEPDKKEEKKNKFYRTKVPPVEELLDGVKELEDSIVKVGLDRENNKPQLLNLLNQSLLERLKLVYRAYPKHEKAPNCLHKVHEVYSGMQLHDLAISYGDSLIDMYPKYDGTPDVMLSLYITYDFLKQPRDKKTSEKYLRMALEVDKDMDPEDRADYEFRLKHMIRPFLR